MKKPAVALGIAAILAVTGCSASSDFSGIYDLPLPGGANLGDHPYQVTAQFQDVLDLVPQAAVKVNDVAVGRVESITLPTNGWTANVTMLVNGDVQLPANAVAWLEQSSLLGEKYIELAAPTGIPAQGRLANDAMIPLPRTNRNPEVEEVFGALSMLLNGGGINQLQDITKQLNNALSGNEPQIRELLGNINTLVSNLNTHRQDITNALDGLNRLAAQLANRDQQIGNVLDNLSPGLQILDQQRGQLVTMLNSLTTLSGVAVNTINDSKADMVADLQALAPTLQQLSNAGAALPQSLQVLITYPFTDAVLDGIKGDYLNTYLSVVAAPGTTVTPPIAPLTGTTGSASKAVMPGGSASTSGAPPTSNGLPTLPLPIITETPVTIGGTPTSSSPTTGSSGTGGSSTAPPSQSSSGTGSPPASSTGSGPSAGGN